MKLNDLTGKRFGRLVVIEKAPSKNKRTMWKCQCDCGIIKNVSAIGLTKGTSKSCGCYNLEKLSERAKHNMSKTRLYKIWSCMKYRCNNDNYPQTKFYKRKGIKLYEPWNDFNNFYEWAKDKYFEGSSIDRINTNGDYEPNNCRFADSYIQANNKTNNRIYKYNGENLTIGELARKYNINYFALRDRLNKGINIKEAIETDYLGKNNKFLSKKVNQYDLNGKFIKSYPSTKEVERQLGIQTTLISQCCRGILKTSGGYKWKYADDELQKAT